VSANATPRIYNIKINTQDTAGAPRHSFTIALTFVTRNFARREPAAFPVVNAGSTTTSGAISIAAQFGFSSTVTLICSLKSGQFQRCTSVGELSPRHRQCYGDRHFFERRQLSGREPQVAGIIPDNLHP
jgi:hypothetical protein